jgi:hypothetical protein
MKILLTSLLLLCAMAGNAAQITWGNLPTTNVVHTADFFPLVTQFGTASSTNKTATLGVIANSLSADQGMLTNGISAATITTINNSTLNGGTVIGNVFNDTGLSDLRLVYAGAGTKLLTSLPTGTFGQILMSQGASLPAWTNNAATLTNLPLSALAQSSAVSGQVIEWNGSAWVATDVQGVTIPNTFTQTNLVANQLYTNTSGSVQMIIGEVALVAAAGVSGRSSFDVMVDQAGGTSYSRYTVAAVQTTALTLAQNYTNSFATAISNSAAFYLTNSSAGSGDSATLVSGQCQLLTLSDGAAAGVATLAGNNTFSGTTTFSGAVSGLAGSSISSGTIANARLPFHTNVILSVTINGNGLTVPTGLVYANPVAADAYTISGWAITAQGASPTATFDVWKIAQGTALPTVANTIMGTKPALSTGNALVSTTLTSWSTAVTKGDIWGVNLDAVTAATNITFQLFGYRQ